MKLDVDGAEPNVLQGASSTLRSPALRSILIEVDETLTDSVTALLNEAGFALADKHKRIHDEQTQWYGVFRRRA